MRIAGRLIAAAGTHVISAEAGMAAVGNVMTHIDFRGRGFAKATTSAVTQELLRCAMTSCSTCAPTIRPRSPPTVPSATAISAASKSASLTVVAHRGIASWLS